MLLVDITDHANTPLPEEMPLIVLSDCFHYPECVLPLYIFEPRYRAMLTHALKSDRMFGVGVKRSATSDEILPVVTAGLVSACVTQEDGTSHLLLLGLRRARITGFTQEKPFRIARIEPLVCQDACQERVTTLHSQVIASLPKCKGGAEPAMQQLLSKLSVTNCLEALCDILTYHFVHSASSLAQSLVEPCLEKRYQILLNALQRPTTTV
jgi:Lon protease-like protein